VPGTEPPLTSTEVIGEVEPGTRLEVSVLVRPRQPLKEPIGEQPIMSREEFAASYGADADDLARIEAFARTHGLRVVESSEARRHIALRGTAAAFGEAFGIRIRRYRDASGRTFRAPDGPTSVPTELAGIVQGVYGFDDRPAARPR
jgi:kumamolisin